MANGDGEVLATVAEKELAKAKLEVISMKPASALEVLGISGDFENISATDVKKLIEFADQEAKEMGITPPLV